MKPQPPQAQPVTGDDERGRLMSLWLTIDPNHEYAQAIDAVEARLATLADENAGLRERVQRINAATNAVVMSEVGKARWEVKKRYTDEIAALKARLAKAEAEVVGERARALRAEFAREHRLDGRGDQIWCSACSWGGHKIIPRVTYGSDPCHTWTDEHWHAEARKQTAERGEDGK